MWPPFDPRAVVFDVDGLLVDSEDAWGEAERQVVLGYGKPWDEAVRALVLGRGPDESAQVLAEYVGAPDPREVDRRVLQAAVAVFSRGIRPRPGALELVTALRGRLPVGAATNSRRVLAELALDSAGLAALLDALVCAEDVAAPKPAPDPYRRACEELEAPPEACVAFEDSPTGAVSAKAAGLWVVGCPSLPGIVIDAADAVVASLTEVDPTALPGQRSPRGS